ncbi:tRNA epoxyqueuosine(34) reductase QueG [Trinickia caryophylli]|uniref:Epoxyqueuosine reductase n=1 Tax=Trinickia caryophylli TaxID=28094 RepID=A0A1X7H2B4_TRICW|nr:tRNA epoxyqueuosine(34) reductase QueG [Trinickia caryophylli]TRX20273.1 tRNA epoxyqueuosine(34) reductase QueG [Trinickia caryophylli]GLU35480.1 epoxyqueuosine reductase [Trinickia caryophylli]SMF78383.1 epoxyqueuosine reductase [Trinickia caryophylli]
MNQCPEHAAKGGRANPCDTAAARQDVSRADDAHDVRANRLDDATLAALAQRIKAWGRELGFGALGISDTDLSSAEAGLAAWLEAGCHGEMDYMAKHGTKRARPAELVAGTRRVITARMAYMPASVLAPAASGDASAAAAPQDWRARERARLADPSAAVVSIYARGRDYHKVMRQRLQRLAERIEQEVGPYGYRVFTDSAPVLEVELAQKSQIGWRGKHTLLLERDAGSLFFLGEIYVDLPLPVDAPSTGTADEASAVAAAPAQAPARAAGAHCGHCTRCIEACPTGAIVAPYRVDARRCISYLTIELAGSIPEPLRPLIGNRVYGCDDCQLACPWNKFAQAAPVDDFDVRHGLDRATLVELFEWSAETFDARMQGSAIRRIGYERWLRNVAVGLGNALRSASPTALAAGERERIVAALRGRADDESPLVREHVLWALAAA